MLTPDDRGRKNYEQTWNPRARQNVIFELGYLFAKLGRKNVLCLIKRDVEKPSDINGIVYLPFKKSVFEVKADIKTEFAAILRPRTKRVAADTKNQQAHPFDTIKSDYPPVSLRNHNMGIIPEYPTRDLDRDDFTGLFNLDGLLNIIEQAIERKTKFSLMIIRMVKGVDSRAKRLLLSHDLASAVKDALNRPVPVGRYSDRIIAVMPHINKPEAVNIAQSVKAKALATLTAQNETLKDLEIRADVYSYPDEIKQIQQVEVIVQSDEEG